MFRRILEFIKKEFVELSRDRKTLSVLLVFPTFLLVIFTYAAKTDIEDLPVAVLDQDGSIAGRELEDAFFHTKYFKPCRSGSTMEILQQDIDRGRCFMGVIIPAGFGEQLERGGPEPAKVQLIIDGSIPPTALQASSYGRIITTEYFAGKATGVEAESLINKFSPVNADTRVLYNPQLDAILFMIPGLVGYILTFLTVAMASMAVIREREAGTFEQLLVTPLTGFEIIVGKLVPYGLISFGSVILILLVSFWWFGMVFRGSFLLFLFGLVIFVVASLNLGFFISTVSGNQRQAGQTAILYTLPSMILSGMYFPIFSMPKIFQALSYLIPLRYFLIIVRGITLKGVGVKELWPDFLGIIAFLVITAIATTWRLNRGRSKG